MALEPRPLSMEEARAFWQGKVPMGKAEFDRLSRDAKARAFAVAGLARGDQLAAVHDALYQAVVGGESLGDFKKRIRQVIEAEGWTGNNSRRVENIYRTNVQSAFQAGRFAQMQRSAAARPYWRYMAVGDRRTRPTHMALHGKVFRHDDPFWKTWYPPNGFMCRCTVTTLSERQVQARGLTVESGTPDLVEPVDPVTGRTLPARLLLPDKGFAGNHARDWLAGLTPEELDREPKLLRAAVLCRRGEFADDPCKPPLVDLDPRHVHQVKDADLLAKGLRPADYAKAFLQEFGLGLGESKVVTIPGGLPMVVGDGLFRDKATGRWKETAWRDCGPYARLLARTILNPFEVWRAPVELPSGTAQSLRLLRPFSLDNNRTIAGFAAFHFIGRRWAATITFAPKAGREWRAIMEDQEALREGVLVYRETLK